MFLYQGVYVILKDIPRCQITSFFGCTYLTKIVCAKQFSTWLRLERENKQCLCALRAHSFEAQKTVVEFVIFKTNHVEQEYMERIICSKCGTWQRVKTSNDMNCSSKLPNCGFLPTFKELDSPLQKTVGKFYCRQNRKCAESKKSLR